MVGYTSAGLPPLLIYSIIGFPLPFLLFLTLVRYLIAFITNPFLLIIPIYGFIKYLIFWIFAIPDNIQLSFIWFLIFAYLLDTIKSTLYLIPFMIVSPVLFAW